MNQQPSVHLDDYPIIQKSVYDLEDYKRRLGRNFDKATDHHQRVYFFNRYNEVENTIRRLVDTYGLKRKYEPHKLDINKV
jgi:hypothetical protein